jgi:hypothetical protein
MCTKVHRLDVLLGVVCIFLLCTSCGKGNPPKAGSPDRTSPAPSLPSPSELAHLASFTEAGLMREGGDFDPTLLSNNVSVVGDDAVFEPVGGETTETALAVYSFDVSSYDRDLNLRLTWIDESTINGELWVGLANYATDRWEWFEPAAAAKLPFANAADYTSPGTTSLYAVVLVRGTGQIVLDRVRIGYDEVETNDTAATANVFPALPFRGYAGHVDTGDLDYFEVHFTPVVGNTLHFELSHDLAANVDLKLMTDTQLVVAENIDPGPVTGLTYTVNSFTTSPMLLYIAMPLGSFTDSDYLLSSALNGPAARLQAGPPKGPPPLDVTLNAGSSLPVPPASIVSYEFDPEGDGSFLPSQPAATLDFTYATGGLYRALVRVRDDAGLTGLAVAPVYAGANTYSEIEDNDKIEQSDVLPALPVLDFTGNVGLGGAYDGDQADWSNFMANQFDRVRIEFSSPVGQGVYVKLYSSAPLLLRSATSLEGELTYDVTTSFPPLLLEIGPDGVAESNDYSFSVFLNPPTADLTATPPGGAPPLAVTLDASGSADFGGGSIVTYEYDPEGDGSFLAPVAQATHLANYPTEGAYWPAVRVTDNEGNAHTARLILLVGGPYGEVEDNDTIATAQPILLPVADFNASLGRGPGHWGYDGDTSDFFSFNAAVGNNVTVTLDYDNTDGGMGAILYDSSGGSQLESGNGSTGQLILNHLVAAGDIQPFVLSFYNMDARYGDYTFTVTEN